MFAGLIRVGDGGADQGSGGACGGGADARVHGRVARRHPTLHRAYADDARHGGGNGYGPYGGAGEHDHGVP